MIAKAELGIIVISLAHILILHGTIIEMFRVLMLNLHQLVVVVRSGEEIRHLLGKFLLFFFFLFDLLEHLCGAIFVVPWQTL